MSKYIRQVKDASGNKFWVNLDGQLDCINEPASQYLNGDKVWYREGMIHRETGPAMEWANGNKSWWLLGKQVTEEEHKRLVS